MSVADFEAQLILEGVPEELALRRAEVAYKPQPRVGPETTELGQPSPSGCRTCTWRRCWSTRRRPGAGTSLLGLQMTGIRGAHFWTGLGVEEPHGKDARNERARNQGKRRDDVLGRPAA